MFYQIKYDYETGNSFGREDIYGEVLSEFKWKDLSIVKENLQRIKEHYLWYKEYRRYEYRYIKEEPTPPTWRKVTALYSDGYIDSSVINLKVDNGKEVQFWAPWCGYFETLYGAEIFIVEEDNDETNGLSFTV